MSAEAHERTSEPARLHVVARAREILRHREVIANLTGKELKVKYKSTALGVVWSMLNPALYLVVFFVVFTVFLRSGVPNFAVYLVSGLLAYTMYSTGFQGATISVVDNSPLVTKVAFPREILPLATIGASLVNFFYQFIVLLGFLIVIRYPFLGVNLFLVPAAVAVLLLFTTAVGMGTAALNVRYRDTGHLVELALLAWFWMTPIVYPVNLVLDRFGVGSLPAQLYLANPLANVTLAMQRAIWGGADPDPELIGPILPDLGLGWYYYRLGLVAAASIVLLFLTWRAFFRLSGDFAEEL
jgi:ABC-2 type transport system permease protein